MAADRNSPDALDGWKEIASYVGRSVRSVQRYERDLGFPVHRIHTADGQTVYAFRSQIDAWRTTVDTPHLDGYAADEMPHVRHDPQVHDVPHETQRGVPPASSAFGREYWRAPALLALMVAAGISVGAGITYWRNGTTTPSEFRLDGTTLVALNINKHVLWSYAFRQDVSSPVGRGLGIRSTDVDGDGLPEVLVPVTQAPVDTLASESDAVYTFSQSGKALWRFMPEYTFHCDGRALGGPWHLTALTVEDTRGRKRIWAAFSHDAWSPSLVVEMDHLGVSKLRYLQSGRVSSLAFWSTPSASYLAAGGEMNDWGGASIVLLSASGAPAMAPIQDGRFACADAPAALPVRMLLMPDFELTAANHRLDASVDELQVVGGGLKAIINTTPGLVAAQVGPDARVERFLFLRTYWEGHRDSESRGLIHHPADQCPERATVKDVRYWEGNEWTVEAVEPARQ